MLAFSLCSLTTTFVFLTISIASPAPIPQILPACVNGILTNAGPLAASLPNAFNLQIISVNPLTPNATPVGYARANDGNYAQIVPAVTAGALLAVVNLINSDLSGTVSGKKTYVQGFDGDVVFHGATPTDAKGFLVLKFSVEQACVGNTLIKILTAYTTLKSGSQTQVFPISFGVQDFVPEVFLKYGDPTIIVEDNLKPVYLPVLDA